MLKWFSNHSHSGSGQAGSAFVGKTLRINDYTVVVEEVVAEGGFAVVFQVRTNYGQRCALKRMLVNSEQDLYLCRQEIAVTKALSDSRHSVTYMSSSIRQISSDVHEVLILLQLYSGGKVIDLMNSKLSSNQRFSEQEVLKIFTDTCQAVARLHHRTKPITHRDLKVENILQDFEGNFVLCDYGSCTVQTMHPEVQGAAECEDQITRFTTLAYRSPEMVSLYAGKSITTKADIWALGCMLYKLCFFTTPFGEQPLAIVSASFTIPDNSTYSEDLHSLIRYMLEPDASKRPCIWQVCEVAFRLYRTVNPIPNVFSSLPPPHTLPRAQRVKDTKQATPLVKSTSVPVNKSHTPAKPSLSIPTVIATTTISSRERPRARPLWQRQQQRPPSPDPTSRSTSQFLTPLKSPSSHSKSLDSGLDAFGAPPFSNPGSQQPGVQQQDVFGASPFTSSHSHGDTPTPPRHSPQQTDEFGAIHFSVPPNRTCHSADGDTCSLPDTPPTADLVHQDPFGAPPFTPQVGTDVFGAAPFITCTQNA